MSEKKRNFLKFIKSGTYTDKSGTRTNTDRAASRVKKIDLDLETMKPASTKKMLTGGQAKIAAKAPPPNKIDAKDFAVLRAEKAKGRGMGLQDEKVKPGKVMKARVGKSIDRKKFMKSIGVFPKVSSGTGGKGGGRDTRTITEKGQFIKRRKKLAGAKSLIGKGGRIGAAITGLTIAGAGAAKLGQTLGKKYDEMKKKNKKMGGGMMQKPMGYKSGMGPAGAAGSMAGRPGGRKQRQQGPKGGPGSMPKKRDGLQIIVMTKDGPKKVTRSDFDNMYNSNQKIFAPKQKMGGGMMKARRGRIVDDQKRDKRNPNRKPSTKIFDKIGDILKTPYYIRGGKKEKKMGGGMMKKYNKGGGADTGRVGEMKSKIGVLSNKLRRQGMRLTKRDIEKAGDIAGSIAPYKVKKKWVEE